MSVKPRYRPEKETEREFIQSAIDKFLAEGGQIKQVDHTANRNPRFIIGGVMKPESKPRKKP